MSKGLYSLFTPIDELPPIERSTISTDELWGIEPDELEEKNETRVCQANYPFALLEQSYNWSYGKSPIVTEQTIGRQAPFEYVCEIKIGGYDIQSAKSNNKTVAKHLAAEKVLLRIIENGEQKKYCLPGENEEEARNYILSLDSGVKIEKPQDNWSGKCTQCCAQKGISQQPKYEFDLPTGPPHQPTFHCRAILRNPHHELTGTGKSKSEAKGKAAEKMFEFLRLLPDRPKPVKRQRLNEIEFILKEMCDKVAEDLNLQIDNANGDESN